MAKGVIAALSREELNYISTINVDNTILDGNGDSGTIGGTGTGDRTHGAAGFLIDEDVLLAHFQLVNARHLHIWVDIDNRPNLGVGSTNFFTLDIALDSLGANRGGLSDSEGLGIFSKFAIIEGIHEVGTFLIVGDDYAEAVFKLLRFRQCGCSNSHGRRNISILNIQDSGLLAGGVASKTGATCIVLELAGVVGLVGQHDTVVGQGSNPHRIFGGRGVDRVQRIA